MTIFRDTLRGLHDVLVFRHFLEIWFLDIFWQVYEYYSRKTTKDRDMIFSQVLPHVISVREKMVCNDVASY